MSDTIRSLAPGELETIAVRGHAKNVQRKRQALDAALGERRGAILSAVDAGVSIAEIARAAGVSAARVSQMLPPGRGA